MLVQRVKQPTQQCGSGSFDYHCFCLRLLQSHLQSPCPLKAHQSAHSLSGRGFGDSDLCNHPLKTHEGEGAIKMETKVGELCLQVKELHRPQAPPEANSPSV